MNAPSKRYFLHAELRAAGAGHLDADNETLAKLLDRGLNRIERTASVYHGKTFNRWSTGLQVVLETAEAAVLGACEMQHRFSALPQMSGHRLTLNIGIHQGTQLRRSHDGADSTIEISVLLAEENDGIVISGVVAAALHANLGQLARPLGDLSSPFAPHSIDWRRELPAGNFTGSTIWPASETLTQPGLYLVLRHKLDMLRLSQASPVLTIGRESRNDLVLTGRHVSRHHCRFEKQSQGVVLIDSSSNGTFVVPDQGEPQKVLQSDFLLSGKGMVFCGIKYDGERRGGVVYEVFA